MINVSRALKEAKIDAKLILQVHDELIIEANKSCVDKAKEILKREMENAVKLLVPLTAQISVGDNWFDAK
jgi:DNA polymerase-1